LGSISAPPYDDLVVINAEIDHAPLARALA
jgi:hypothetical protein